MATIKVGNTFSVIEGASPRAIRNINSELSVDTPGCQFNPMYQEGNWDGKTKFLKKGKKDIKFPTGHLDIVNRVFKECDEEVYLEEDTVMSTLPEVPEEINLLHSELGHITLRDYQYESVYKALKAKRGVINVATNGGKCITKKSRLLTSDGYKTVEQIFRENGTPCEVTNKTVPARVSLINRYGEVEGASHLTFNGVKPVRKITTKTGLEQESTYNHPLLVVLEQGDFVWKNTEDIKVGDQLVTRLGDEIYGSNTLVTDPEEAYCLGALIADAYLGQSSKIAFTNNQEVLLSLMESYLSSLGGRRVYREIDTRSKGVTVAMSGRDTIMAWHNRLGIEPGVAKDKRIPQCIMESPKEIQIAFLSGYLECECSIDPGTVRLEVTSASKELCQQVQILLKNMGVLSVLKEKKSKGYEHNYYGRLTVHTNHCIRLMKLLRFRTAQKVQQLDKAIFTYESRAHRPRMENVPNGSHLLKEYMESCKGLTSKEKKRVQAPKGVSKHRMRELLDTFPNGSVGIKEKIETLIDDHIFFDTVVKTEEIGECPTFDVHMPETHSFVMNSIINHNTEIACGIIQCLLPCLKQGQRLAFFTHSKEIFTQSHKRIEERLGMKIGRIGDGKWDERQVTVVMIPTISRNLSSKEKEKKERTTLFLNSVVGFLGDEVHHASSDTWYKVFMSLKNAEYRFGLTGTIDKSNQVNEMRLYGCTGRVITRVSNKFLIDRGYSAKPTIFMLRLPGIKAVSSVIYPHIRRLGIIENVVRNTIFVQKIVERANSGKQCLVIVNETEHGNIVLELLQKTGVNVEFSHGDKSSQYREEVLNRLKNKELQVLVATTILDEGVDVSGISCVFLMAGGKSMRQLLQRVGRGLRKKEDGGGLEVYDALDYHHVILTEHLQDRYNTYKNEGFDIKKA